MNPRIKKHAMNFGLIAALIGILYTLVGYIMDPELLVNWWAGLMIFIVYIVLFIMTSSKVKKEQDGFISFKDAFTGFVLTSIISGITAVVFNLLLFNMIDPEFGEQVKELQIEKSVQMMENFGADEAIIDKSIADLEATDNYAIGTQVKGFFMMLMFNIIIGLIVAAVMKKNPPLIDESMSTDTE